MTKSHAILSPSGASRWLKCPVSARFEMYFDEETSTEAEEGSLAHAVAELILKLKLDLISKPKYDISIKELQRDELYNEELHDHANDYAIYVMAEYYDMAMRDADTQIFIEHKLDLTAYIPEGFGTADIVIYSPNLSFVQIIDFKYGQGVLVKVKDNSQLKIYALGVLGFHDPLGISIQTAKMTIFQPRLDNIESDSVDTSDLYIWGKDVLKVGAELAFTGMGDFIAGDHCHFCLAAGICKTNAEKNLEIERYDYINANRLTPEQVADILDRISPVQNWIKAVKDLATEEARKGKQFPGYKLVEGRSNRTYSDENEILKHLKSLKFKPEFVTDTKLLNLTKLEKAIGSDIFNKHIIPRLIKPSGAPTLVPESDSRSELGSGKAVFDSFQKFLDDEDYLEFL